MTTRLSRLRELNERRTQGEWKAQQRPDETYYIRMKDRPLVLVEELIEPTAEFIAASANLMGDLLDVVDAAKNYLEPVVYGYDASDAYEARCEETRRYETLKAALSKLEQP